MRLVKINLVNDDAPMGEETAYLVASNDRDDEHVLDGGGIMFSWDDSYYYDDTKLVQDLFILRENNPDLMLESFAEEEMLGNICHSFKTVDGFDMASLDYHDWEIVYPAYYEGYVFDGNIDREDMIPHNNGIFVEHSGSYDKNETLAWMCEYVRDNLPTHAVGHVISYTGPDSWGYEDQVEEDTEEVFFASDGRIVPEEKWDKWYNL